MQGAKEGTSRWMVTEFIHGFTCKSPLTKSGVQLWLLGFPALPFKPPTIFIINHPDFGLKEPSERCHHITFPSEKFGGGSSYLSLGCRKSGFATVGNKRTGESRN